jgi:predicted AAA+ superfamily ATPase
MESLITRQRYIERLHAFLHTPEVKVLIGVRRSGKSSILRMFANQLEQQGTPKRNMFFRRMDDFDLPLDYDAHSLYAELQTAMNQSDPKAWFHVFLDEIQDIEQWEDIVRRLHTRAHTDVYITGSNAQLLSSELATRLTGRYVEIPVFPLSYREFRTFIAARDASDGTPAPGIPSPAVPSLTTLSPTLHDYLSFGGMPGIFALRNMDVDNVRSLLSATYESILFSDVAARVELRSTPSLERVSRFLIGTSGNLFSLRKVTNTLKSGGISLDVKTIDSLITALAAAFVIYPVTQEGVQGKSVLRPLHKYYPVDVGIRSLVRGFGSTDVGARLESVVYMELLRRGFSVSVGALANSEIDFVATRDTQRLYIQVTNTMLDEYTRNREMAALQSLSDAFPRLILTADTIDEGVTADGIQIINVEHWLLLEQK